MTVETIQFFLMIVCLALSITLAFIRIKNNPCTQDQEIKYDPKNKCFFRVAYDPVNHCYYWEKLEIKDSENESEKQEYKNTYFQPQGIIPFSQYKLLGGADRRNRGKRIIAEKTK